MWSVFLSKITFSIVTSVILLPINFQFIKIAILYPIKKKILMILNVLLNKEKNKDKRIHFTPLPFLSCTEDKKYQFWEVKYQSKAGLV